MTGSLYHLVSEHKFLPPGCTSFKSKLTVLAGIRTKKQDNKCSQVQMSIGGKCKPTTIWHKKNFLKNKETKEKTDTWSRDHNRHHSPLNFDSIQLHRPNLSKEKIFKTWQQSEWQALEHMIFHTFSWTFYFCNLYLTQKKICKTRTRDHVILYQSASLQRWQRFVQSARLF